MPALSNHKHELFAQGLAKGQSASEAYVAAGYSANTGNASTLKGNESVSKRVFEIQAENAAMAREATEMACQRLSLSREWVLDQLRSNALSAAQNEDYGPSNRALELIGKEIAGMFVDRKHVDIDGEFRGFSDAQLVALLASESAEDGDLEEGGHSLPH